MLLTILSILFKIIGIILLILIALILLILLVPIRYWAKVDAPELRIPTINARVSWFLRAIMVLISYVDETLIYEVKLFGFVIKSNSPEYLAKKEEKSKEEAKEDQATPKEEPAEEPGPEEETTEEPSSEEDIQATQAIHEEVLEEDTSEKPSEDEEYPEEIEEKQDPISRAIESLEKVSDTINDISEKIQKAEDLYDKLHGEALIRKAIALLEKLLRHILPQKLSGYMKFGFDDPALTGYATGFAATLYPVYGRNFTLDPDFYETCFQADCEGSGRIRLMYLLYLVIWLLIDKDVRRLIRYILKKKI